MNLELELSPAPPQPLDHLLDAEERARLAMHLEKLADHTIDPIDVEEGICDEVLTFLIKTRGVAKDDALASVRALMDLAVKEWPLASSDEYFPITLPGHAGGHLFNHCPNKWSISKAEDKIQREYIRLRLELSRWLAGQLHLQLRRERA